MIDLAILEMIHIRMAFLITALLCTTCFKVHVHSPDATNIRTWS